MFTLRLLYREAAPLGKLFTLALFLFVFIFTIIRVYTAIHANQERNSHVHTRRSTR